ncbi:hypothetical protein MNQ98_15975 [Paenibacillus sp. N3/727]|uniref:hypothetical protein n=1 Tax=Paenibacillus sp. N3/727 TaxID=2925845 RepID=UPI001F5384E5|nr:hypothetical protein [Paenibacillus sp. N3/727]UNK16040.1 hypothetical protein MNQ98_15975 [Paenibacillus sp. N3/727]
MLSYIGNGAYCYANSLSMLLETIGEKVSPQLLEVLSGVGIGATWIEQPKLLFFGEVVPDRGVSHALELLGYEWKEISGDVEGEPPLEELRRDLECGPVLLGPLDMGHLTYNPNAAYLGGSDHFVLAYKIDDNAIYLHDPAGFPYVSLPLSEFVLAWKAECIIDRVFSYHYWAAPKRKDSPSEDEIFANAVRYFQEIYQASASATPNSEVLYGKEAILRVVKRIKEEEGLMPAEIAHFSYFAFQLGARRAMDYAEFLIKNAPELAAIKEKQAKQFGRCHTLIVEKNFQVLADAMHELADMEEKFRRVICES